MHLLVKSAVVSSVAWRAMPCKQRGIEWLRRVWIMRGAMSWGFLRLFAYASALLSQNRRLDTRNAARDSHNRLYIIFLPRRYAERWENQQWEAIVFGLQQGQLFALSARRSASRSLALWENSLKLCTIPPPMRFYTCVPRLSGKYCGTRYTEKNYLKWAETNWSKGHAWGVQ